MKKIRLDQLLTQNKMAETRSQAQRIIMSGEVKVNGQVIIKPGTFVMAHSDVVITEKPRYVSRGGYKLEAALDSFGLVNLEGCICVDVGASTGGFTDCLLQHNAKYVYAVDVGYGLLHWKIRNDPRVKVMERNNARFITKFPDTISLVTIDASFISLKILLPVIKNWFESNNGDIVALVKPQFEAGREEAAKGAGVIRNPEVHRRVILNTINAAEEFGFGFKDLIKSPLLGPKGNAEFLVHLKIFKDKDVDIEQSVNNVFIRGKNK